MTAYREKNVILVGFQKVFGLDALLDAITGSITSGIPVQPTSSPKTGMELRYFRNADTTRTAMIIEQAPTGKYIKLEKSDFSGHWRGFVDAIKKLPSAVYEPVEIDESGFWFIGNRDWKGFLEIKKTYLDDIIAREKDLKSLGYRPLARKHGKFAYKRLRF